MKNHLIGSQNYLSGRTVAVVAEGYQSSLMSVNKGGPQGSIQGPLLFTVVFFK